MIGARSALRLTVLGGSGVATPELFRALLAWDSALRPAIRLTLQGRDVARLEAVAAVCTRLVESADPPIDVVWASDLEPALEGAELILIQVRVGGLAARQQDETFPHELGLFGEETLGPGGFANALRTVPVLLDLGRQIASYAPRATVLNLTNPTSIVQHALARYAALPTIGICDAPVTMTAKIATLLGRPTATLTIDYLGMNHLGWITAVHSADGDLLDDVLVRADELQGIDVDAAVVRASHAIPNPYYKYVYHADRKLAQQHGRPARASTLQALEAELLHAYSIGDDATVHWLLQSRSAHWYAEVVVPAVAAIATDTHARQVLNFRNDGYLPWLDPDAIVEAPAMLGAQLMQPITVAPLPAELRPLLQAHAAYERLATEAIVERSAEKALRASLVSPFIASADQATAVLDRVWPSGLVHESD